MCDLRTWKNVEAWKKMENLRIFNDFHDSGLLQWRFDDWRFCCRMLQAFDGV